MTRKKLLLTLFVALIAGGAVTIALIDRDKRLTFRLAQMRFDRQSYVKYLVENYCGGTDRVKRRVLLLFERMDPRPVTEFIEIAKEDDPVLQAAAVTLLIKAGPDKIAKLIELCDDDPAIQAGVARALIRSGGDDVVPTLETAIMMPNAAVQWWAINMLRNMGPAAGKAAKSLANLSENNGATPHLRAAATDALGDIGDASAPYIYLILQSLDHDDPELRASAARTLGLIGVSARDTLANLTNALRDDDAIVRENAWVAIRQIRTAMSSQGSQLCDLSVRAP
jgi:HEAT repeat protein